MTRSEIQSITDSVRIALNPDFGSLHEKINGVAGTVSAIEERTSKHMPTKEQVALALEAHAAACVSRRRWMWGLLLGLPAAAASVASILSAVR